MPVGVVARVRGGRVGRRLIWLAPLILVVLAGVFYGVGVLTVWLWRVTLVDIFAIKPIRFWQAWGLILLSQILFKANIQARTRTGRKDRWTRGHSGEMPPEAEVPGGASPQG